MCCDWWWCWCVCCSWLSIYLNKSHEFPQVSGTISVSVMVDGLCFTYFSLYLQSHSYTSRRVLTKQYWIVNLQRTQFNAKPTRNGEQKKLFFFSFLSKWNHHENHRERIFHQIILLENMKIHEHAFESVKLLKRWKFDVIPNASIDIFFFLSVFSFVSTRKSNMAARLLLWIFLLSAAGALLLNGSHSRWVEIIWEINYARCCWGYASYSPVGSSSQSEWWVQFWVRTKASNRESSSRTTVAETKTMLPNETDTQATRTHAKGAFKHTHTQT